ncbi:MAG: glycoside hydrolase family 95 protein, partial [Opitutaceae bacterium]|nr:glycoside hydrolase family 95 protein [Opitutaceae bacterium]
MKRVLPVLPACLALLSTAAAPAAGTAPAGAAGDSAAAAPPAAANLLRYDRPAADWNEALPVGNGRLGAMVRGGAAREVLSLNEATLWSGAPREWNNPAAPAALADARAAIFAGDYLKADRLCREMQGLFSESYQPLGDLVLDFLAPAGTGGAAEHAAEHATAAAATAATAAAAYERTLDLDRAVAVTRCEIGGVTHTREVFASWPDQLIVVRLAADRPGALNFNVSATTPHRHTTAATAGGTFAGVASADSTTPAATPADGAALLALHGRAPAHIAHSGTDAVVYDDGPNPEGMVFALHVRVVETDGEITAGGPGETAPPAPPAKSASATTTAATAAAAPAALFIRRATRATLLVSAATSFNGPFKSPGREGRDAGALAVRPLDAAGGTAAAALLERHAADHRALY